MPLNAFLEKLHAQTTELHALVSGWMQLPATVLLQQPEAGAWSVAQCLDHLNGYGDFYIPHLARALNHVPVGPVRDFRSGWLGNYFAGSMEPDSAGKPKSKMKAFAKHQPPAEPDADGVLRTFLEQQASLLQLLERARGADLNHRVTPLSIASWLKLKTGDVFRFLVAHNRRHIAQAQRALSVAGAEMTSGMAAGKAG